MRRIKPAITGPTMLGFHQGGGDVGESDMVKSTVLAQAKRAASHTGIPLCRPEH
jgi:hypothetical protein